MASQLGNMLFLLLFFFFQLSKGCAVGVVKYMLLLLQENIDVKKNATIILVEYWNKKVGILGIQSLWKLLKVRTSHVKTE